MQKPTKIITAKYLEPSIMSKTYQLNAQPSLRRKASLKDYRDLQGSRWRVKAQSSGEYAFHKYPSPPKREHKNFNHRALGLVFFVAAVFPESFFMGPGQIAVPWEEFRLFQLGDCPTFSVWIFSAFSYITLWRFRIVVDLDGNIRWAKTSLALGLAAGKSFLSSQWLFWSPVIYMISEVII